MQPIRTSVLVAPVVILLLFSSVLVGHDRLAFRDVGHFYAPLYDYVAQRCASQWLPLWNPHDHTGMPLAGETTTAVFYPVRYAVFALPIASEVSLSWYVVLHLILACFTAFLAARWSSAGVLASSIAAVVYPLSGSVLFLYTNPPFLVGAAWVPLVVGSLLTRTLRTKSRLLIASLALSMMLLGGDPQTALHAMILVIIVAVGRRIREGRDRFALPVIFAAPILAAMLAAPQLAASVSWSRQSDRVQRDGDERLADPPLVGSKRFEAFQYSLAPWHSAELVTPNAFGSLLPSNRRMSQLIPGDGRMWTPSIYMGMLTLLAMLYHVLTIRGRGLDGWTAMALLSLFAAMGHFGVVWWIQTLTGTLSNVDSAVGGPYWILYHFLPGYDSFRYPAKWLTLFSLAAAIITAQVVERGFEPKLVKRIVLLIGTCLIMSVAATALLGSGDLIPGFVQGPADEFWGPLDAESGLREVFRSLIHSIVVLGAITLVILSQRTGDGFNKTTTGLLLIVLVFDLGMSGKGMLFRVPRDRESALVSKIESPPVRRGQSRWIRTQSSSGWPSVWREMRDDDRLSDVEASGRAAWFGRWHLADRTAVVNNMVSIRSLEMARFWTASRRLTSELSPDEQASYWRAMRHWLDVDGVVHCSDANVPVPMTTRTAHLVDRTFRTIASHERVSKPTLVPQPDLSLRTHPRWKYGVLDAATPALAEHLRLKWKSGDATVPVVQQELNLRSAPQESSTGTGSSRLVRPGIPRTAERIDFAVNLAETMLLTRPVFQDGHWQARIAAAESDQWQSLPVHKVDHLIQGVILPAGDWKLQLYYRPWWFAWSIAIAVIGWICIAIALIPLSRRGGDPDVGVGSLSDTESAEHPV